MGDGVGEGMGDGSGEGTGEGMGEEVEECDGHWTVQLMQWFSWSQSFPEESAQIMSLMPQGRSLLGVLHDILEDGQRDTTG